VLPDIRGAQLYGYLDRSTPAPEKELKAMDKDGKEITIATLNMHAGSLRINAYLATWFRICLGKFSPIWWGKQLLLRCGLLL
jgi:hypothetical protein